MTVFTLLAALAAVAPQTTAAAPHAEPAPDADCSCLELFDSLVATVETNYPGYHLEVRGTAREAGYLERTARMRTRAASAAPGIECLTVLQTWVAGFEDGHLFVGGRPPIPTAEDSARLRAAAGTIALDEDDVLDYLDRATSLDPIEGIWYDPAGVKLAVVRQGFEARRAPGPDDPARFDAVVLASNEGAWAAGDVRARFEALPDGSYEVVLHDDARAPTRPHVYVRGQAGPARLQRGGLLLHMPPTTWGRLHPVAPGPEGRIDPLDPRAPTVRLVGDDVVVFHVPSHVPSRYRRMVALVEQYHDALGRAELLVIDLRGNEGGSSRFTDPLMPYLVTPGKRPERYLEGAESVVLASEDNVAYFRNAAWAPAGLVGRLEAAAPGSLVPFADLPAEDDADPVDVATAQPRHVAILTDGMTVSAAEAFVLRAMRNHKVTLFGEPTGASIDYQTVSIVRFGCREAGLYVGYPVIVGSDRLPDGGVRPTGIVPDVPLDADDPHVIERIIDHYRAHR